MLPFSKFFIGVLFILIPMSGISQHCTSSLSGRIKDAGTMETLESVHIYILENGRGTRSDSNGHFILYDLCPGLYHIQISHIGCESKKILLNLQRDTLIELLLEHSAKSLEGVVIQGTSINTSTEHMQTLREQVILDHADENLSNLLENLSGVSSIRNGNGISKPVIHGLYGNRLAILNNGIPQSGQQWGNDHSPEIDPLTADKIRVIKGSAGVEYPGANLGSIIIVEPGAIGTEPHLHGHAGYFFESNGRGNGMQLQALQYTPKVAWKAGGTLKYYGDRKTSSYFLNNTGAREANVFLQLEKKINEKLHLDFYGSSFNTELGILRGSHIGNISDLEEALQRDIPFYTEDTFSYHIDAPKQKVHHQLLKLHAKYFLSGSSWLDANIAWQYNNRKEFDLRRGGRSDIPSLSLQQYSYYAELKYEKEFQNSFRLKSGLQYQFIDNTNNPETGILPLIPDYYSYEGGCFAFLTKTLHKSLWELGMRYDLIFQNVAAISPSVPRQIIYYDNAFHNTGIHAGYAYYFNKLFRLNTNLGYGLRNPAINELYSGGLHQGVSGMEFGNPNLKTESSVKISAGLDGEIKHRLSFESLIYYQDIKNYIFLQPQNEIRLTIRGAFPVFQYEQTRAKIWGFDFSGQLQILHAWKARTNFNFIRGYDQTHQIPLIYIPSNRVWLALEYQYPTVVNIGSAILENMTILVGNQYVFKQNNLLPDQDFVPAPEAYNLFGVTSGVDIQLLNKRFRFTFKGDNLLNVSYRDYLNRQRYFSDDLGRNIILGLQVKF